MLEILYVAAVVLLGSCASVGHRVLTGYIIDRPRNPGPLNLVSGVAGLAATGMLIGGFFAFSWWVPLLAIAMLSVIGAMLTMMAMRSMTSPGIALLYGLAGFMIGAAVVLLRLVTPV